MITHPSPTRSNPGIICLLALVALALFSSIAPGHAQVIVYKMSFKPLRAFNIDFYDSGYFVAPAKGGAGSFIFTIKEKTPHIYNATGTGEFFPAKKSNGKACMGVRADVGAAASGAFASYLAWGTAWRQATLTGPTFSTRLTLATSIKGAAIASSDEKDAAKSREVDLGFASTFDWRLMWDEDATSDANALGQSVSETITTLTEQLKRNGFRSETEVANPGTGTGTGTGTNPNFGN